MRTDALWCAIIIQVFQNDWNRSELFSLSHYARVFVALLHPFFFHFVCLKSVLTLSDSLAHSECVHLGFVHRPICIYVWQRWFVFFSCNSFCSSINNRTKGSRKNQQVDSKKRRRLWWKLNIDQSKFRRSVNRWTRLFFSFLFIETPLKMSTVSYFSRIGGRVIHSKTQSNDIYMTLNGKWNESPKIKRNFSKEK